MSSKSQSIDSFLAKFPELPAPRFLGDTAIKVSPFGFGAYRVNNENKFHKKALEEAINSGINLIDTSSNYSLGSSEEMIGNSLKAMAFPENYDESPIVVISKVGYVQGAALERAKELKSQGQEIPDMIEINANAWHCIHPEYIEWTLQNSLQRLKLNKISGFLLHNPECFFKNNMDTTEYYHRIEKAFSCLENLCDQGLIDFYGISSNSFVSSEQSHEHTSLIECWNRAQKVSKNPRFKIIQFPYNLVESEAWTNQLKSGMNIFDQAKEYQMGVLVNRPFNAFKQDRLMRLASFAHHEEAQLKAELHTALQDIIAHERSIEDKVSLPQELMWGQILRTHFQEIEDLIDWIDLLNSQIVPTYQKAKNNLPPGPEIQSWLLVHESKLQSLLKILYRNYENQSAIKSEHIKGQLIEACPKISKKLSLSQIALQIYLNTPHVDSILCGMRSPTYVGDILDTPMDLDLNRQELETLLSLF